MKKTTHSIPNYVGSLDESKRDDVATLHKLIVAHMPGVKPVLWEGIFWGGSTQAIIGYGDLTFARSDKRIVEWFMVGLSLQKNYISVYVTGTEDGQYLVKKYGHTLGKAKLGSSSISFSKLSDINIEELLRLIDKAYLQLDK